MNRFFDLITSQYFYKCFITWDIFGIEGKWKKSVIVFCKRWWIRPFMHCSYRRTRDYNSLESIMCYIEKCTKNKDVSDMSLVWFGVNDSFIGIICRRLHLNFEHVRISLTVIVCTFSLYLNKKNYPNRIAWQKLFLVMNIIKCIHVWLINFRSSEVWKTYLSYDKHWLKWSKLYCIDFQVYLHTF